MFIDNWIFHSFIFLGSGRRFYKQAAVNLYKWFIQQDCQMFVVSIFIILPISSNVNYLEFPLLPFEMCFVELTFSTELEIMFCDNMFLFHYRNISLYISKNVNNQFISFILEISDSQLGAYFQLGKICGCLWAPSFLGALQTRNKYYS